MQVTIFDPDSIRKSAGAVGAQAVSQILCNVFIGFIAYLLAQNIDWLKGIFSLSAKNF